MTTGNFTSGGGELDGVCVHKDWTGSDLPPGFKRTGAALPDHPYSMNMYSWRRTKTRMEYDNYGTWKIVDYYDYAGKNTTARAWSGNDELKLLSKIADELRGHSFDASIFVAESAEAVETISLSCKAVFGLVKSIYARDVPQMLRYLSLVLGQRELNQVRHPVNKRGKRDWRNASPTNDGAAARSRTRPIRDTPEVKLGIGRLRLGDVAGAWLAVQYAWKPLLQDIYEAMRFVESVTGSYKITFRKSHSFTELKDDSVSPTVYTLGAKCMRSVSYKVTLTERPSTMRSLGLQDPLATVWELVPFSFVVDWFIPIGSYLSNRSFFGGFSSIRWVRSEYAEMHSTVTKPRASFSGGRYYSGGSYFGHTVSLKRTIGTGLNVPLPNMKNWGDAFSTGHLQNLSALIGSFVSSIRSVRNFT